jgi:glycosyltransferase involved in cell wall biosynthesis
LDQLTGILLTYQCVEQDYCFVPALESLIGFCDKVIVMDCGSTDGTKEKLLEYQGRFCRVITEQPWEVAHDHTRLAILSNMIREQVQSPWYFHLQADEVVHEASFTAIRCAILNGTSPRHFVRRINFWRDCQHYIPFDAPNKPCGDSIVRLAQKEQIIAGDAESVEPNPRHKDDAQYQDLIQIMHYGMVRDGYKLVEKCINMQSWFWGKDGQPDANVLKSKAEGKPFNYDAYDNRSVEFRGTHPKFAQEWVKEHTK